MIDTFLSEQLLRTEHHLLPIYQHLAAYCMCIVYSIVYIFSRARLFLELNIRGEEEEKWGGEKEEEGEEEEGKEKVKNPAGHSED